jgi:hypothetical protein
MDLTTKAFLEKCALRCLASGGVGNLVKPDARSQAFMFTHVGKDTPFSDTSARWQEKVTDEHYSTMVSEDMVSYYTVLVNRVMRRVHLVDVQHAVCFEALTGRATEREAEARLDKNRKLASSSPVMLKCIIPECLYKHKILNPESSTQRASELFSQASHQILARVSERIVATKTAAQLYPLLKHVDDKFKRCFGEGVVDVDIAEQMARRTYGEDQLEEWALLFILTQSKMRMQLNIPGLKLAKRNADVAAAAVIRHRASMSESRQHHHHQQHQQHRQQQLRVKPVDVVRVDEDDDDDDDGEAEAIFYPLSIVQDESKMFVEDDGVHDDDEIDNDDDEDEKEEDGKEDASSPPPPAYSSSSRSQTDNAVPKKMSKPTPIPDARKRHRSSRATSESKKRKRSLLTHAQQDAVVAEYSVARNSSEKHRILKMHDIEAHDIANWKRRHDLEEMKAFKQKQQQSQKAASE